MKVRICDERHDFDTIEDLRHMLHEELCNDREGYDHGMATMVDTAIEAYEDGNKGPLESMDVHVLGYEVNISITGQHEDTSWNYIDCVYTETFDTYDEAEIAALSNGWLDLEELAERYHREYPDRIAFEIETSTTEEGDESGVANGCEYYENECIWSRS